MERDYINLRVFPENNPVNNLSRGIEALQGHFWFFSPFYTRSPDSLNYTYVFEIMFCFLILSQA